MRAGIALLVCACVLVGFGCTSSTKPPDSPTSPTPPTNPTPPTVYRQGTLRLPITWIADLDKGEIVFGPLEPHDVWFQAVTPTEWYLTPEGGRLAMSGTSAPGYDGCSVAPLRYDRIPMGNLSVGLYLCAITDEGRIAELRVAELPQGTRPVDDPALTLSFKTYNK